MDRKSILIRVGQYGLFATNTITIQLLPNCFFTIQLQYNTENDFYGTIQLQYNYSISYCNSIQFTIQLKINFNFRTPPPSKREFTQLAVT